MSRREPWTWTPVLVLVHDLHVRVLSTSGRLLGAVVAIEYAWAHLRSSGDGSLDGLPAGTTCRLLPLSQAAMSSAVGWIAIR